MRELITVQRSVVVFVGLFFLFFLDLLYGLGLLDSVVRIFDAVRVSWVLNWIVVLMVSD